MTTHGNGRGASLLALLVISPAAAHDLRLEPNRHAVAVGETVRLYLNVGDALATESQVAFRPSRIRSFAAHGPDGVVDLGAMLPSFDLPVLAWRPSVPGSHLLAMEREYSYSELSAARFAGYLEEEALHDILHRRDQSGAAGEPGRERYLRYLKTLIRVGDGDPAVVSEPLGQRLEIVPLRDPTALVPGEQLSVRVLYEGSPLVGRELRYLYRDGTEVRTVAERTDDDGVATFPLHPGGGALLRLVHMIPVSDAPGVDWESLWAAFSFSLP